MPHRTFYVAASTPTAACGVPSVTIEPSRWVR